MKIIIPILAIALILRIIATFYQVNDLNFNIQQDNYADYASALNKGFSSKSFLNTSDTRLFPGYPILIFMVSKFMISPIVAGYMISLFSSLLSIYLFWRLTGKKFATLVFAVFPPIWIAQSVKVATEPITVLLLLISIILYKKKMIFYSGIILGLATDIRLISISLLAALILQLTFLKHRKGIICLMLGFLPIFFSLFIYNYFVFGVSGIFRQFEFYPSIGQASIGFIQIFKDFAKAILEGQYRTLFSGLLYILITLLAVLGLYKKRRLSSFNNLCYYWMLFSLLFIFTYGPTPLLGEYGRFLVPVLPALIVGIVP
ncbi:MAG: hypothetical protein Q7R95_06355 [bacterium]|nr:hypothetical protein [bacterium]